MSTHPTAFGFAISFCVTLVNLTSLCFIICRTASWYLIWDNMLWMACFPCLPPELRWPRGRANIPEASFLGFLLLHSPRASVATFSSPGNQTHETSVDGRSKAGVAMHDLTMKSQSSIITHSSRRPEVLRCFFSSQELSVSPITSLMTWCKRGISHKGDLAISPINRTLGIGKHRGQLCFIPLCPLSYFSNFPGYTQSCAEMNAFSPFVFLLKI